MEFDLEMKKTKLVKGKGLARLLAESNYEDLGVNFMNINSKYHQDEIVDKGSHVILNLTGCT
jgi:hypothetical protein